MILRAFVYLACLLMSSEAAETNFFVERSKRLLEWDQEKLTSRSHLTLHDLNEIYAPEFVIIVNGKKYVENHQNYFKHLNHFRADINSLDYEVQEYLSAGSAVIMPMTATVQRSDKTDIVDLILLVKFDTTGKVIHWQEV